MGIEQLGKAYDPKHIESKWYQYWLDERVFTADNGSGKAPYCIVIPPPNVTGVLHMGHALQDAVMDILTRFHRMMGREALWLPGTDHAGIATQAVVERHLAGQGVRRQDLGRERFVEQVWEWKERHHAHIVTQLRQLGCGLDWTRERFTLDEGLSRAVREAFCRLHEDGLIYRGPYMVNWCPHDHTTISDEEVNADNEVAGHLWHIEYPLADGSGSVVVATTRPETMLGDTAVAVNPNDPRQADKVGKKAILPLMNREIPIIADERVELGLGAGALKVTPAHDKTDYEIGQDHHLPSVCVIGRDGKMAEQAGTYAGLDRFECRKRVLADLEARGLLKHTEDYRHLLPICSRCNTVIEPLISTEWFVNMRPLADAAIAAQKAGKMRYVPPRWEKMYLDWLESIRPWAISRQLWWGHRIPAWYCADCAAVTVAREDPTECAKCGSKSIEQDQDVLDTWFSSGLWPFSTMGWPEKTADLRFFFPTTCLVTGYDIITFWVVRMVTMSLYLTGEVPFADVFIHGLVRNEQGRKVSKSLGTAIDPLELVEKKGADALRFALASLITHGQDIRFSDARLESAGNFCNKIYQAARFALMNLEDFDPAAPAPAREQLSLPDRWILSRTRRIAELTTQRLTSYDFGDAAMGLYDFLWGELCDWYVELAKPLLYGEVGQADAAARRATQWTLRTVLSHAYRLLHPIMPFLTEELWHALPGASGSIVTAAWPTPPAGWEDPEAESEMQALMDAAYGIRTLRADAGVAPRTEVTVSLRVGDAASTRTLRAGESYLRSLVGLTGIEWLDADSPKPHPALATVSGGVEVFLHAEGAFDVARERERLTKEVAEASDHLTRVTQKLSNASFVDRAPEDVVQRERDRQKDLAEKVARLTASLEALS